MTTPEPYRNRIDLLQGTLDHERWHAMVRGIAAVMGPDTGLGTGPVKEQS